MEEVTSELVLDEWLRFGQAKMTVETIGQAEIHQQTTSGYTLKILNEVEVAQVCRTKHGKCEVYEKSKKVSSVLL